MGALGNLLKFLFGDVPSQWVRLFMLGVGVTVALVMLRDFRRDVRGESASVREALVQYMASNKAWQDATMSERAKLLARVNYRLEKIYRRNGMDYDPVEP